MPELLIHVLILVGVSIGCTMLALAGVVLCAIFGDYWEKRDWDA